MKVDEFPGTVGKVWVPGGRNLKGRSLKCVLNEKQERWLERWYPVTENGRLSKMMGVSVRTMQRFAGELGVTKSAEGLHGIKVRHGRKAARTMERNGYFDSIRGKPVSENTLAAVRRMWQEVREGKRKHPIRLLKEQHPRIYQRKMKERGEARKELIRRDKFRLKYGLRRLSALKAVVMCPYTRRQLNHRYRALKKNYIVMEDYSEQGGERYNIYYDEKTERSAQFERNLEKDGFRVKKWTTNHE